MTAKFRSADFCRSQKCDKRILGRYGIVVMLVVMMCAGLDASTYDHVKKSLVITEHKN